MRPLIDRAFEMPTLHPFTMRIEAQTYHKKEQQRNLWFSNEDVLFMTYDDLWLKNWPILRQHMYSCDLPNPFVAIKWR